MIIKDVRHVIVYRKSPLRFNTYNSGEFSDSFEDAWICKTLDEASVDLSKMDCPEEFELMPVVISFEI